MDPYTVISIAIWPGIEHGGKAGRSVGRSIGSREEETRILRVLRLPPLELGSRRTPRHATARRI